MKRITALAALALVGLAACGTKPPPLPETQVFAEAAFRRDEIYGARHINSNAPCPGLIDGIERTRASINLDTATRFDWCGYSAKKNPTSYAIRFQRVPGETNDAALANLKASEVTDAGGFAEAKSDFPDRQAVGLTWSKAGSASKGIWVGHIGDWRIAVIADYPENRRDAVTAAANDYFRKVRTR